MATRVWESAIFTAPIDAVWALVRPLTFTYNKNVASTEVEEKKTASEVGAVVRVTYRDGTVQRIKVVELSDATRTVSWELIESIPAVAVLGAAHTIRLRRVTDVNGTFAEWTTDFSKDASQAVLQDQRFKQKDSFTAISAALETKEEVKGAAAAPAKRLVGGPGGMYNPAKARQGVVDVWEKLQSLQKAAGEHATLNAQALTVLCARYKELPIQWQINWALADLNPAVAQRIADEVRTNLNAAKARLGDNGLPLPRLFNGNAAPAAAAPAAAAAAPAKTAGAGTAGAAAPSS